MLTQASRLVSIEEGARLLALGQLVAFATETVYGLGADATNPQAVAAIFARKGRPKEHPLIVHVAGLEQAMHFTASIPAFGRRLLRRFWPGPLTLIVPRRAHVACAASGNQTSIGLRAPSHPIAQALLQAAHALGVQGVAAPSANRFGRISPTTATHVHSALGPDLAVLDGGPCSVGIESTIVDCTRVHPVLLRPGILSRPRLEKACGERIYLPQEVQAASPKAPGTLVSHYAPKTRLVLWGAAAWQAQLGQLQQIASVAPVKSNLESVRVYQVPWTVATTPIIPDRRAFKILKEESQKCLSIALYRLPVQAEVAARTLFAQLRAIDDSGVAEVWVQTPPNTPEWDGVRDRLERAAKTIHHGKYKSLTEQQTTMLT